MGKRYEKGGRVREGLGGGGVSVCDLRLSPAWRTGCVFVSVWFSSMHIVYVTHVSVCIIYVCLWV